MAISLCPECGAGVDPSAFQCAACEILLPGAILDVDAPARDGEEPSSIVRGMLSLEPMKRGRAVKVPVREVDELTRPWTPVFPTAVPRTLVGIELAIDYVHPLEAHILSFVDGVHTVEQISTASRLSDVEFEALVRSLVDRGVLELCRQAAAPPGGDGLDPQRVLQEAVALERGGKPDQAIKLLEQAIARTGDAPLYNRLALVVLKNHRNVTAARGLMEKALELDPENEKYRRNLELIAEFAARRGRGEAPH